MTNEYPIIEFHILQSFPVSCLNRDDVGAPKSCLVGGIERARVSSQCWKRAVRLQLHDLGVRLGIRTKKVADRLLCDIRNLTDNEPAAVDCANAIASAISKDSLLFLTDKEYVALAAYAQDKGFSASEIKEKEVQKILKKAKIDALDGLDIALFGRMVAKASSINVEAAASFSHAISTHACGAEFDFFTAMDDVAADDPESPDAGHMGTTEFNSATYYRYVSLNLNQLAETLGVETIEGLRTAIEVFVKALYLAVPSARQATMSAAVPWDFARVYVRNGQRMQCSFDRPVRAQRDGGYLQASIATMTAALDRREAQCGSLFGKIAALEFGGDSVESIDALIERIIGALEM